MNKRTQLEREKLLFRYSAALERGDFESVSAVLRAAQDDPTLARMIDEINAVYGDESVLQSIRPSLHSNNNHATKRGDIMQTTFTMQPDLINQHPQKGLRYWYSAPLIAAALAMVILGGLLLASKPSSGLPGTGGDNNNNGAQVVDTSLSTPTPAPSSTPFPTLNTPVPVLPSPVPATVFPQTGIAVEAFASPNALCTGMIDPNPVVEGVNLFSRPSVNGLVTTRLPGGTAIEILEQIPAAWGEAVEWYFVSALVNNQTVQGWVSAEGVIFNTPCLALSTPTLVPTPTAFFEGAFNLEGYPLILLQPVGEIPAGTAVRISVTWFDPNVGQRYYDVVDEQERFAGGVPEQLLSYAPGINLAQPSPVQIISVTPTSTPLALGTATFTPTPAASHTPTPIPAP